MKTTFKTALLSCAALCLTGTSYAADLILVDPPMYSPTPAANWEGFYAGVQLGFASGFADHLGAPNYDLDLSGGLLGGKIGYNMYLADQFVGGIEADFNAANITGTDPLHFGPPTHTINWLGSVRGRLGYDAGQFMPYVTGGIAFASATRTTEFDAPNSATATHLGYTVGAGLEFSATDTLSLDIQARYYSLGEQLYVWSGAGVDPTIALSASTVTVGANWHF